MRSLSVVKFGGSLSKNPSARTKFLKDLASLAKKGDMVLVHGGGPEINSWLAKLGIESKFVDGLRYTDEKALEVVEMALSGKLNKGFVADLKKLKIEAVGLSGKDGSMIKCSRVAKLGFVGEPSKVDVSLVKKLLDCGYMPVVSSLGFGPKYETLNLNADSVAMALAVALKADKLILLTDVPGVLDKSGCTIKCLRTKEIEMYIKNDTITGGMIPKINACRRAVQRGVREVWIIDGTKGLKELNGTVIK